MLGVFPTALLALGMLGVFSIAPLEFHAQHVYNLILFILLLCIYYILIIGQGGVPPASPATNRRRRSRNPNEETDGTLMDFLQQSNKDRLSVGEWSNSI